MALRFTRRSSNAPTVLTLEQAKQQKLDQISEWTKAAITGGFISNAMGSNNRYDSEDADQQNLMLLRQVSTSPDFADHPIYKGKVPIRAIPEGGAEKIILMHSAVQVQKVVDDLALHIGKCKQRGWTLQETVGIAGAIDILESIVW